MLSCLYYLQNESNPSPNALLSVKHNSAKYFRVTAEQSELELAYQRYSKASRTIPECSFQRNMQPQEDRQQDPSTIDIGIFKRY